MIVSRVLLILAGLVYLAFGFLFFFTPDAITDMDGIVLPNRSAANHIRAVLGGMEIGLGLLLLFTSSGKDRIIFGLIILYFSIGATSLTRLYGIIFDGALDNSNIISFIAEFSFALAAAILHYIEKTKRNLK